jgi:hypothetical protein
MPGSLPNTGAALFLLPPVFLSEPDFPTLI